MATMIITGTLQHYDGDPSATTTLEIRANTPIIDTVNGVVFEPDTITAVGGVLSYACPAPGDGIEPDAFGYILTGYVGGELKEWNVPAVAGTTDLSEVTDTTPLPTPSSDLELHEADTTNVHGIADTSLLVTDAVLAAGLAEAAASLAEVVAGLSTAAAADTSDFGSAAQGALADTAVQPGDLAAVATSGSASDITVGTLPTSVLPPLAINETFPVASQAAMLALTAQRGDMAIRSDVNKTFVLASDSPGTLADWKEVMAAGQVLSVAGQTGVVSLAKSDVDLGNVDNTSDANKPVSTAAQTALNLKADATALATETSTRAAADTALDTRLTIIERQPAAAARPTSGQETFSRYWATSNTITVTSGVLKLTYFTADATEAVNSLGAFTGAQAAAATPTLCKMALFSVAGNGDLTLIAVTANDTSLFAAATTRYTKATTAQATRTAGQRYAHGLLVVTGTTAPQMAGATPSIALVGDFPVRIYGQLTGQTDIPSSIPAGSLTNSNTMHYGLILP
jgi:hypothetical protein